MKTAEEIVDQLLLLLESAGSYSYDGEAVSQLEHALQCAELARSAHSDGETVVASLLHDIGHLVEASRPHGELGVIDHAACGGQYLRELGFPAKVVDLVAAHVAAKRYLVAIDAAYAARLSPTSQRTLELQGGPMSAEEQAAFAADPLKIEKVRLRSWDESAKRPGHPCAGLTTYRSLLLSVLG
jgi:phosphonate degradation associated HDIG domain protein